MRDMGFAHTLQAQPAPRAKSSGLTFAPLGVPHMQVHKEAPPRHQPTHVAKPRSAFATTMSVRAPAPEPPLVAVGLARCSITMAPPTPKGDGPRPPAPHPRGADGIMTQLPAPRPVTNTAAPGPVATTTRKKRARIGSEFASQAELEAARKARAVDEFMAAAPPSVLAALLGGEAAVAQVPSREERLKLTAAAVALRAGPDGGSLESATRAWTAFAAFALARGLPDHGLPASAALVASFLSHEGAKASGSQGGSTVANSRRVGLLWLAEKLGFAIQVDNVVVLAAGNPDQVRKRRRTDPVNFRKKKAGSIPIKVYCLFESLASQPVESPTRFFARSVVAFSLLMSVRAVDALRTVLDPDETHPDTVISGWSYFSKDGEAMRTFAPASGFLGPLKWWPAHARAVAAIGRPFPKWDIPWGGKGSVRTATGPPLPFVMPKAHLVKSLAACMTAPPLGLTESQVSELGLTAHSEHGSPSDQATSTCFVPSPGAQPVTFERGEVRELGHWLRLGDLEDRLEGGTAGAQGRRRGTAPGRQATGAFGNDAAEMAASYCEGDGREGRRRAQLRVRRKWTSTVASAIAAFGRPWVELPVGRSDYDILDNNTPTEP